MRKWKTAKWVLLSLVSLFVAFALLAALSPRHEQDKFAGIKRLLVDEFDFRMIEKLDEQNVSYEVFHCKEMDKQELLRFVARSREVSPNAPPLVNGDWSVSFELPADDQVRSHTLHVYIGNPLLAGTHDSYEMLATEYTTYHSTHNPFAAASRYLRRLF